MKTKLFETEQPLPQRRALKRRDDGSPRDGRSVPPAKREQNKSVKQDRIKDAARALFTEMDYEKATVRAIAARAGVALGTVSLYAQDKRDLILLACNDDVEVMIACGAAMFDPEASFEDNLIDFVRVFYEGYAANLQLARTYLQINFFAYGINAKGLALNRQNKLDAVSRIVENGQRRGEVRNDVKPDVIAMQFLFLHSSAVRGWILEDVPQIDEGVQEMRRLIELQTQGLSSRPGR